MPTWSTRYATKRITDKIHAGIDVLQSDAVKVEYLQAAGDVAEWWSRGIARSGRGGSHNRQMASIETRVTKSVTAWNIRVGWLGNPPMAEDGKTTWFVYQDTGYHLFGGSRFIPGLMLQLDARQRLEVEIRNANERIANKVQRAIRRG